MVKLAYTLDSGSSGLTPVRVQIPSAAYLKAEETLPFFICIFIISPNILLYLHIMSEAPVEEELLAVAVDDETMVLSVIEEIAREAGVKTVSFTSAETALRFIHENRIDMVFADCRMSQMDGIDFIRELRKISAGIPIIMVTVFDDYTVMADALDAGVTEFIPKPVNPVEALARIRSLSKLRSAQLQLANMDVHIEMEIGKSLSVIKSREVEELLLLGSASGFREGSSPGHCMRVADCSKFISLKSGADAGEQQIAYHSALLHDIGKSNACHNLIVKPVPYGDDDRSMVSEYAMMVSRILDEGKGDYISAGGEACLTCFEWFDGTGYPPWAERGRHSHGRQDHCSCGCAGSVLSLRYLECR